MPMAKTHQQLQLQIQVTVLINMLLGSELMMCIEWLTSDCVVGNGAYRIF
jgi:hypothetical protein